MTDLTLLITKAFGGRIAVESELGGGGMSRVFLAREPRLGRRVVVKVLPPELAAGLSAERFRREIELAARLQHPNLVPLLDVGADGDIVAFTMPFVEGESLRSRLDREGALDIRDAVRLWQEIVDALGYAHLRGVIHRDIKPENVLLSGRHAMVSDFGVAKALGEATEGRIAVTLSGVSIGTPAYMSPEQAAGDSSLDHRTDFYSAALVMWEMATGRHPFAGMSPHQLLGAQVLQGIPPLREVSPDIPDSLSEIVSRCLSKSAGDRPARASELLDALEAIRLPDSLNAPNDVSRDAKGLHGVRWRRLGAGAAVSLIVASAAIALTKSADGIADNSSPAKPALREEIVAADSMARVARSVYRTVTVLASPGAPNDSTLGRQARDLLASTLRRDTTLLVPTPDELRGFMRNARIQARFFTNPDTLAAVGREASHAVVHVDIGRFGKSFAVTTLVRRSDLGTVVASFHAVAEDSAALPQVLRSLGDSVLRAVSRTALGLERLGAGRFAAPAAVRLLLEANAVNSAGNFDRAVELARAATRADSNYADAWRFLSAYLANAMWSRGEFLDAAARAYALRHRTNESAELSSAATYWLQVGRLDSAAALYRKSVESALRNGSGPPYNQLAFTALSQRDFPLAEAHARAEITHFRRAVGLTHPVLVSALIAQGKLNVADSLLRAMESTHPSAIPTIRSRWLRAEGTLDYAKLERSARVVARSGESGIRFEALMRLALALSTQGRFSEADSAILLLHDVAERRRDAGSMLRVALMRATNATIRGDSASARRLLNDAERTYSPASLHVMDRHHETRANVRLRLGELARGTALVTEWQNGIPPMYRELERSSLERAQGEIAMASGRAADALTHFRRAPVYRCVPCDHLHLARAFDKMRQSDSALTHFTRYLDNPGLWRQPTDAEWLGFALRRLGELHEERGEWAEALARYEAFLALWSNADPAVQHLVVDAKKRIAVLRARTG